jgi:arabinose-5-phosphate isomerase
MLDREKERHILLARELIRNEARALDEASRSIGHDFVEAVEMIAANTGRLYVCGMGKSGYIAAKIASTFSSSGTPAVFLRAGEAVHGDLCGLSKGDLLLTVSHSGETPELVSLLPVFKSLELQIITITDALRSTLSLVSAVVLMPGPTAAADPLGLTPTASTTAALAIGDALALAVAQHNGYRAEDFHHFPGGALGKLMESVYARKDAA